MLTDVGRRKRRDPTPEVPKSNPSPRLAFSAIAAAQVEDIGAKRERVGRREGEKKAVEGEGMVRSRISAGSVALFLTLNDVSMRK